MDILARSTKDPVPASLAVFDQVDDQPASAKTDALAKDAALGDLLVGKLANISRPAPTGKFTLYFEDNSVEELWLAVTWGKGGG